MMHYGMHSIWFLFLCKYLAAPWGESLDTTRGVTIAICQSIKTFGKKKHKDIKDDKPIQA